MQKQIQAYTSRVLHLLIIMQHNKRIWRRFDYRFKSKILIKSKKKGLINRINLQNLTRILDTLMNFLQTGEIFIGMYVSLRPVSYISEQGFNFLFVRGLSKYVFVFTFKKEDYTMINNSYRYLLKVCICIKLCTTIFYSKEACFYKVN